MMHDDYEFWRNPPGAPTEKDRELFRNLIEGERVLLLGSTKMLLELATDAYDLCPKWDDPKIQDRDWLSINSKYDTIMGCGVFNFTTELTNNLFLLLQQNCSKLVVRTFYKPNWETTYAKHFPEPNEFPVTPEVLYDDGVHRFFVWDFK